VKLVHLVGFITKKSVTTHGHMNVKFRQNIRYTWLGIPEHQTRCNGQQMLSFGRGNYSHLSSHILQLSQ